MHLQVCDAEGDKVCVVEVEASDKIATVKEHVSEKLSAVSASLIHLFYKGSILENDIALTELGITSDSVIFVAVSSRLPSSSSSSSSSSASSSSSSSAAAASSSAAAASPVRCYQVFVKVGLGCKTRTLDIDNTTTILELKKMIEDKEGIPPDQQRIIYRGKLIQEDWRTAQDVGLDKESSFHCILKLRS
jgi:large subunit ribosomal protein L40e